MKKIGTGNFQKSKDLSWSPELTLSFNYGLDLHLFVNFFTKINHLIEDYMAYFNFLSNLWP